VSKYRNVKTTVDGVTFDSKAEAKRWGDLQLLERAGRISGLRRQVKFELAPAVVIAGRKRPAVRYIGDFGYLETRTGEYVVEDVKGIQTPVFRLKRHLMKHVYDIEVRVYP
jgi:hypothetical protein